MKMALKIMSIISICFGSLAIIGLMDDPDGMAGIIVGLYLIATGIVGLNCLKLMKE